MSVVTSAHSILRSYRPGMLGGDFVLPRAAGLKRLYLSSFGLPDVRLQLTSRYLLEGISPLSFRSMLDVGCGSGLLTALIAKRHTDSLIIGVDRDGDGIG